MPLGNSSTTYGAVTKSFHWATALLILTAFPLGIFANDIAHAIRNPDIATTEADVARAAFLFSLHKSIGVAIFFVALARILWALGQPKPGLLNGDRPAEALAAETVHWLLYGSLVAVPLSGWVHHAATTGFAPIWWPFGQSLPFVPKDPALAELTGTLHYILQWVLLGAVGAHIAGAFKHHLIDGDATLRRMLPGASSGKPTVRQPGHTLPFVAALVVWGAAIGGAASLGWFGHALEQADATTPALQQADSEWQVTEGTLSITVKQLGSDVAGQFDEWTADISYSETPDDTGRHGSVTVMVSIPSLTLGSVTNEAKGADYLDASNHPTATFEADIVSRDGAHVAQGSLTIKGQSVPVQLPFDLTLEGNMAQAQGELSVDRRDFGIGEDGEGNVGASVAIAFELTAERP